MTRCPRGLALGFLAAASLGLAQRGDAPDTRLRSPAEQRTLLHVPPGFEVQLVAAEPDIQKPLNLAFDAAGRLWVTGSSLYPWPARRDALGDPIASFAQNWDDNPVAFRTTATPPPPAEYGTDTLRVLADFDPATGRARTITTFADGLNIPVGVLPLPRPAGDRGDTVLVFSIPAIWRLTDSDGDGRADRREKLYDGFGFKDTHGMSSSYWLWLDGWVYGTHGFNNRSVIVDRAGRTVTIESGNTYRFRPDGSSFEVYAHGQTNPFGLTFDARGHVYTADSHSKPVYLLVPGGFYEGIRKEHDGLGFAPAITSDDHGSSAIAGLAHYAATHFPAEFRGNLFNGNPVTRRINRARLDWRGSSPTAARQADFLTSDDPAFRPVQVQLGPDGALWIADFYNPIIGHYEVPLTHPARDQRHGRLWRIVWRGLDGSLTPPTLPDLTRESTTGLVARLADPNLMVRSLAAATLRARADAATALPRLHAAAARCIAGSDPITDDTAALPLLLTMEQLGQRDEALLATAFQRPDSDVTVAALRTLAARDRLPPEAEGWFRTLVGGSGAVSRPPPDPRAAAPGLAWRIVAEILARTPQPWGAPLLLAMQERTPASDFELIYALKLALKSHALTASGETLHRWADTGTDAAERLADVCLAVPTPAAAEYLLGHLEAAKFAGVRAAEFARHAVQHVSADRLRALTPVFQSLADAPLAQRLTLAEGLAKAAAQPNRPLPAEAQAWLRQELLAAVGGRDNALALRAINALKDLPLPEKAAPLARIALDPRARENLRVAAVRALPLEAGDTEDVLVTVLDGATPPGLRRAAAEVLGRPNASPAALRALAAALTGASADLAVVLATSLAKSEAGATELVERVSAGTVRAGLLRHRHVELALALRPADVRERVTTLTRALPPEDLRLDALIAQRVASAGSAKGDAARGAAQFATHCAACHRFRGSGGSLGPSLDGLEARSVARLVEDIIDPSRNIDPAFRLTTVVLRDGGTRPGLNLREDADRVVILDPSTGEEVTLLRSDVREFSPSPVSPMPATFETALSESEFFDLLEFLRSPAR